LGAARLTRSCGTPDLPRYTSGLTVESQLSDLEVRQLNGYIDQLFGRLVSNEVYDWTAWSRRETGETDPLIEYLFGLKERCLPYLQVLAGGADAGFRFVTTRFIRWAYEENQFFELEPVETRRFFRAHRRLFHGLAIALDRAESVEAFAASANAALYWYVERMARVFHSLGGSSGLGRGAEYTAELQMQLLGLNEGKLLEPVVDLGCGQRAELVSLLRGKGIAATGLDRLGEGPFVLAKDWFDVRFEPKSIGTIVSHLAFSLHFLHHHWHSGERAYEYARKYMELLNGLVPGGSFVYAPGLPFIEAMLEEGGFSVEKRELPAPLQEKMAGLRDLGTGQSVAYVARVRRHR
jgi:hypothetical protein